MTEATRVAPDPTALPDALSDLELYRAQLAALEQLLEVHEHTSLEQAERLQQALDAQSETLTRERAARDAQRETDRRLRLALDAGRMGTWEWDLVGNRVLWSPEEERLYGVAEGTFTGTIEAYREFIHPDDRDSSVATLQDALARRAPTHHVMHRIVRPDGEVRWLDSHAHFIFGDDGRPVRLVGVSTDITDRREIEAARDRALADVRRQRQRLAEVFMQAPAAIAVLEGPEHRFSVSNPLYQQLVGGREVIGRTVREALPELEGQGFYELLDGVFNTGESYSAREMAVRIHRAHGPEEIFVDFVYQPLRDVNEAITGILVHAVDTTSQVEARREVELKADELSRLTQELERSNGELDQFAYVASHDLKAPLRGIANLTQWIEEDLGESLTGESREHMQLLKGRVNRMEALIDGILTYSRAGRVREKPERIDVGKLVADAIELLAAPATTTITVGPDMPVLETERVPLQQVFLNLISNAIKYNAQPGARVDVTAEREDDGGVRFAVADNGPGIAPQYRERIWQIFQTLAPRDKVEGTGIGLSVVRKTVESRGGRAWLESEVGRGTTFYFTWPTNRRPAS